ncbi:MAG: TIGR01620 family protein [Sediminimonas qiaohouensis]|uniref:TIGR01620 family protein n=1 Tax=Sediminimonas qiaohouensis TaxID=552061 RepID=A0A7C9H980_9RHOB|nr:YcjF family protein [Sediminimonas qiaohouensis]MTJ03206.1 TIGR01620 family protein [Sediminimonas qiaohouensis]
MTKGPVIQDAGGGPAPDPQNAPPVPDDAPAQVQGRAMQRAARLAARRPSRLARWGWGLALALVGAALSVAAWDFAAALIQRLPLLGYAVVALIAGLLIVLAITALRELAAYIRLGRIDRIQQQAQAARDTASLTEARAAVAALDALYRGRDDLHWARARLTERQGDPVDAADLLELAEAELLTPLDRAALAQVETAARQVAMVTALVPLALADVIAALTANIRMIRAIAEIYGGRSGLIGGWRLTRAVMAHMMATGAVAIGDDMIGSLAGGGLLSKLSRRFGEGVVNGALTARVGVAAMAVCRPLPYGPRRRPSVSATVRRALSGLFNQG